MAPRIRYDVWLRLQKPRADAAPIALAHALTRKIDEVRQNGELTWLRPDGKAK